MSFTGMSQIKNIRKYLRVKVRKNYTIGESQEAVLFEFYSELETYYVWINKKAIYTSYYTDILDISLIDSNDYKYSIYKDGNYDWKKPDAKVSGKELKEELLKDSNIAEINKK